ncbi:hypothetical protein JXA05_02555 [Candidatus Peregrinibacteria bacterium]|nr:hypothetical protein [Candidatus Peregrinibacteria bacterium]
MSKIADCFGQIGDENVTKTFIAKVAERHEQLLNAGKKLPVHEVVRLESHPVAIPVSFEKKRAYDTGTGQTIPLK